MTKKEQSPVGQQKIGHRSTKIRTALQQFLSESCQPLSAVNLSRLLIKANIPHNRSTIYREIACFVASGFIKEVKIDQRAKYYEPVNLKHHHHLVCLKCRAVEQFLPPKSLEKEVAETEQQLASSGFKPQDHSLEFFGLCRKCN